VSVTEIFVGHDIAEAKTTAVRARLKGRRTTCCVVRDDHSGSATAYAARLAALAKPAGITVIEMGYHQLGELTEGGAQDPVIFLQPAPTGVNVAELIEQLGPLRDAEGLHPLNVGRCALGDGLVIPPTAHAALLVAQHLVGPLAGKKVTIVGASQVVGQPLALLMMQNGATVRVAQQSTLDLKAETRDADVIISATGVPNLIGIHHVRQGAVVIDVGVTRVDDKLVGDADQNALDGIAAALTHVPGGVGPITAACLFENVAMLKTETSSE